MSYLDKVTVGSTTYDIQDTKAQGDIVDLKSAIDDMNGQTAIVMTDGYYIALNGTTADVNSPVATQNAMAYAVVACQPGDRFTVSATGGATPRAWAFVESNGTIIIKAASAANVNDLHLMAPAGAAYLVINNSDSGKTSYVGWQLKERTDAVTGDVYGTEDNLTGSFVFTIKKKIVYYDGTFVGGGSHPKANENYVDISRYDKLRITMMQAVGFQDSGIAFYSGRSEASFISGVEHVTGDEGGVAVQTIDIPYGAKYVRATYWSDADVEDNDYPSFSCYGIVDSAKSRIDSLENRNDEDSCVSILFIGNSLTQDGIAYLPYVLKEYYPNVKFKFYMWYNGGKTLAEHYQYFVNNTACRIFSIAENNAAWTNFTNTVKMSSILTSYRFDIVCMQEYYNERSAFTEADLAGWNNCQDYITEHYTGGNGLEFITLFHAPVRDNADSIFNLTVTGNDLILKKTIADDMIPNGIAVYRALSTELDELGDEGHLSPDGLHTQEGLPCLLQTFVTLRWMFEKRGIMKSFFASPIRMTEEIYNTLNVPGANLGTGVIAGTDEQNLLAQKVAVQAVKEGKYYVNNSYAPGN